MKSISHHFVKMIKLSRQENGGWVAAQYAEKVHRQRLAEDVRMTSEKQDARRRATARRTP
ncbi:hypothetical protein ACDA63_16060 [Uliginosibacterium sp. sgz301328]|uniref:hypothetical protein n=1 Tax=Uliginosibacterium sp. sgz301328 TaxID=3243764 RepID=UPI00359D111A